MNHICHAPGCIIFVPPRMFMCKPHWFSLPKKIRNAIWREYRPGQEIDKDPSFRYLAVQQLACAHSVFKPDDEEAVMEALLYLSQAFRFQRAAVAAEEGDPFEGLTPDAFQ